MAGKSKSEIVLEALERYLAATPPALGKLDLGACSSFRRADLYGERLKKA